MSMNTDIHAVDNTNTLESGKVKWIPVKVTPDGGLLVETQAGSTWAYGNWPNTVSLADVGVTAADAEVLATLTNSTPYNMLTIVVSVFTATALNITVSQDGSTFGIALPSKDNPVTAGAAIAAVGTYHLFGSFDSIAITQSGAGGVTAQYRQWVS